MSNQIPLNNYLINIIDNLLFWISISIEHLSILNSCIEMYDIALCDEDIEKIEKLKIIFELLDDKTQELKDNDLSIPKYSHFLYSFTTNLLKHMHEINSSNIEMIETLGKIESTYQYKEIFQITNHITREQKQFLEITSGYLSKLNTMGFIIPV